MKFEINGYDEMTTEQKLAALEAYEPDMTGYVTKATFDKVASEAAGYKKQLKNVQSAKDADAQTSSVEIEALQAKYNDLNKSFVTMQNTNRLLGLGYDEKLAAETAQAMAEGDIEKVFQNQLTHQNALLQKARTDSLEGMKRPAGAGQGTVDYSKQIAAAQADGDYSKAAYYMRLAQSGK